MPAAAIPEKSLPKSVGKSRVQKDGETYKPHSKITDLAVTHNYSS